MGRNSSSGCSGNTVFGVILVAFLSLFSCGQKSDPNKLTVAAAANTQYVMEELAAAFTAQTAIKCQLIFGSSGKLTAQIIEGAPYDVFVAADIKYPNKIYSEGLAREQPKIYASGKLVLWSFEDGIMPTLDVLATENVEHIAIANPKTAPYGRAAIDVLDHFKLLDRVERKLVYGESIAQTNQFITSMSAQIGFTAMAVVMAPEMAGKGRWTPLPNDAYDPIEQGVVVIKRKDSNEAAAAAFYDFLFTAKAKKILNNFGYSIDE